MTEQEVRPIKPSECAGCGYNTEDLTFYNIAYASWLCELCASTETGNAALYPNLPYDRTVLKTMVQLTHIILDRLDARMEGGKKCYPDNFRLNDEDIKRTDDTLKKIVRENEEWLKEMADK